MKSADDLPTIALIKENASFCGRCYSCCAPGSRATKYDYLAFSVLVPFEPAIFEARFAAVPLSDSDCLGTMCSPVQMILVRWRWARCRPARSS
jgi:hypothetical protein